MFVWGMRRGKIKTHGQRRKSFERVFCKNTGRNVTKSKLLIISLFYLENISEWQEKLPNSFNIQNRQAKDKVVKKKGKKRVKNNSNWDRKVNHSCPKVDKRKHIPAVKRSLPTQMWVSRSKTAQGLQLLRHQIGIRFLETSQMNSSSSVVFLKWKNIDSMNAGWNQKENKQS